MGMGTITKTTIFRKTENLLEITRYFLWLHIESTKSLYPWSIYNITAFGQLKHFAECGSMHSRVMGITNLRSTKVHFWQDAVYQCRLTHSAVSAQDRGLALQQRQEFIHHITWGDVKYVKPLRANAPMQKAILAAMCAYPFMAHNAAFEDSWFMLNIAGYAEARKAGRITVIDSRDICRRVDPEVRTLPRESRPATLENWARRRGTLLAGESEVHLGLDDVELMLRTVQAEFAERNMF